MATRQLTFAGGAYDRTQALIDGTVKPEGVELNWLTLPYLEIWKRMLNYYDFDASELSFSSYLIGRSIVKPLIAIPVFLARAFRHSYIFHQYEARHRKAQGSRWKEDRRGRFSADCNGLDERNFAARVRRRLR